MVRASGEAMAHQRQKEAAIFLAVCGAVSGALSALIQWEGLKIDDITLLPALFFGAVVVFGLNRYETGDWRSLALAFLAVCVGWWCAVKVGGALDVPVWVAGIVAGFVGGAITAAGVWFAAPDFQTRADAVRVVLLAAIAGILIAIPGEKDTETARLLVLFVVWQAGVAGLIGYALGKKPRRS
jgi:hypothetical protein